MRTSEVYCQSRFWESKEELIPSESIYTFETVKNCSAKPATKQMLSGYEGSRYLGLLPSLVSSLMTVLEFFVEDAENPSRTSASKECPIRLRAERISELISGEKMGPSLICPCWLQKWQYDATESHQYFHVLFQGGIVPRVTLAIYVRQWSTAQTS